AASKPDPGVDRPYARQLVLAARPKAVRAAVERRERAVRLSNQVQLPGEPDATLRRMREDGRGLGLRGRLRRWGLRAQHLAAEEARQDEGEDAPGGGPLRRAR